MIFIGVSAACAVKNRLYDVLIDRERVADKGLPLSTFITASCHRLASSDAIYLTISHFDSILPTVCLFPEYCDNELCNICAI